MIYCLFEQSGVFKNAFKSLDFKAIDVDIQNDFNQTDKQINLFDEIRKASMGLQSFFDEIKKDDLVFAFFPCTRFQSRVPLLSRGEGFAQKKWTDLQKLEYSKKIINELEFNYSHFCELFTIALLKGFKMVVENPYSKPNFLREYFPIKPSVVIENRADYGDTYKKPTQFFFINFKPSFNFTLKNDYHKEIFSVTKANKNIKDVSRAVRRSYISPEFALNFIKEFILSPAEFAKINQSFIKNTKLLRVF